MEETAIKDLCFDGAWDRVLFVALEKAQRPKWLPDRRIYLDFETFGFSEAVGAIKARCVNAGIDVRPPTALDLAKRLAAEEKFKEETERLIRSSPQPLRDAAVALFAQLECRFAEIEREAGWGTWRGSTGDEFVAGFDQGPSVQLLRRWSQPAGEVGILGRLFSGRVPTPQERGRVIWEVEAREELQAWKLNLTRMPSLDWCWQEGRRILSTEAAAEYVAATLVAARSKRRRE